MVTTVPPSLSAGGSSSSFSPEASSRAMSTVPRSQSAAVSGPGLTWMALSLVREDDKERRGSQMRSRVFAVGAAVIGSVAAYILMVRPGAASLGCHR